MSLFTGTVQAKLIDNQLNDFGTQDNPVYTRFSQGYEYQIYSVTGGGNNIGDTLLISGIVGKSISVFALSIFLGSGQDCTAAFTDGQGGSNLFITRIAATNQMGLFFNETVSIPSYLFATSAGNGLYLNLTAPVDAVANISYFLSSIATIQIPA